MIDLIIRCETTNVPLIIGKYTFNTHGEEKTVSKSAVEDDTKLRSVLAEGVKKGLISVRYTLGSKTIYLTASEILRIDEAIEEKEIETDTDLLYTVIANVVDSDTYTVTFGSVINVPYIPIAFIEDNLNTYLSDVSESGFKVHFSANYTGKIYIAVFKTLS